MVVHVAVVVVVAAVVVVVPAAVVVPAEAVVVVVRCRLLCGAGKGTLGENMPARA